MADLRPGVRLGLDWGKARIGVAACDAGGILAFPVETVPTGEAFGRLAQIVAEYEPVEVVVGLPLDLRGQEGIAAGYVREQAKQLANTIPVPVRLCDERLSTTTASRRLGQAGRNTRAQRAIIDQAAAVEILQAALEAERAGVLGALVQTEETQ